MNTKALTGRAPRYALGLDYWIGYRFHERCECAGLCSA